MFDVSSIIQVQNVKIHHTILLQLPGFPNYLKPTAELSRQLEQNPEEEFYCLDVVYRPLFIIEKHSVWSTEQSATCSKSGVNGNEARQLASNQTVG